MTSESDSKPILVMKFGGTSVQDAQAIQRTIEIVKGRRDRGFRPVVVVSAMARVTDELIAAAQHAVQGHLQESIGITNALRERHHQVASALVGRKLLSLVAEMDQLFARLDTVLGGIAAVGELTARTTDLVSSFGERLSSLIIAQALEHRGISSGLVDARLCIITDSRFGRANPQAELIEAAVAAEVLPLVQVQAIPVLGGFIGSTATGITTTLGRGGSDYTAALLGRALRAGAIEIWTDVNGVMTTDPRICPAAKRLHAISFEEASELAYFGAKVLHPSTILPAVESGIPVWVLNSRDSSNEGTVITAAPASTRQGITSIAVKRRLTVLHIKSRRLLVSHGFLRKVFETLDRHEIAVNMLANSEISLSVALDQADDPARITKDLEQIAEVTVEEKCALVCLVGDLSYSSEVATRALESLRALDIKMISLGANRISMNVLLAENVVEDAVRKLHADFFPGEAPAKSTGSEQVGEQPQETASFALRCGFRRENSMAWHLVDQFQGA